MTQFIQIHLLTAYPAANLNRDDTGSPKTVVFGGAPRLRISSQSLKRAWRTSDIFKQELDGHIGVRTALLGRQAAKIFLEKGIDQKKAVEWASKIANGFGKVKSDKKNKKDSDPLISTEIEQLVHVSQKELKALKDLCEKLAEEKRDPTAEELQLLTNTETDVDIALFGRMLASSPKYNVEAACQVAHAFGVGESVVEDDFFTAIDDLKLSKEEDLGAGHLGETAFGSALFYSYICINFDLLIQNLGGDEVLAKQAVRALTEAAMKVSPSGKQNSFGSRAYAYWAMIEKGIDQPRSLATAFCRPVFGIDQAEESIKRIVKMRENLNAVYGQETQSRSFNTLEGQGTLKELLDFVG